jgi:predicted N-acetyltransferase YhbS
MSIREASAADLDAIVELGSRSLRDGPYAGVIKDVPAQARKFALQVMQGGKILLGEDEGKIIGLLGFIVANHHFSEQRYAVELMWYVLPEHRKGAMGLKLLWEAEKQANEMGAEDMCFSAPNDDVAALYARFGYRKLETTYMKSLPCHS